MKADLHMHSTYSDGRFTAEEIFIKAKENGVDVISITDHDIVIEVKENKALAKKYDVMYIPGIELSTIEKGKPVHILGYFKDDSYLNKELIDYFKEIKMKREERTRKMIHNLKEYNSIDITYDEVVSFARGIIARPHIAKAIASKYPHYDHNYIFDHFIGDHSKAYVPSCELSVQEGIDLLRRNNCLIVLAHPTLLKSYIHDNVLDYPFDGLEAKYYRNKHGDEEKYRNIAAKNNWIITGGSDFHGIKNDTLHGEIGDVTISEVDLKIFLDVIKK